MQILHNIIYYSFRESDINIGYCRLWITGFHCFNQLSIILLFCGSQLVHSSFRENIRILCFLILVVLFHYILLYIFRKVCKRLCNVVGIFRLKGIR